MKTIEAMLCTTSDIGLKEIAEAFFNQTETLKIQPEYISFVEPISDEYSFDKAVRYWCKEEDGVWDLQQERWLGQAGGLLARNRSLSLTYIITWHRSATKQHVNYISFYVSNSKYKKIDKEFLQLFRFVIHITNAVYGYIAHSDTVDRQHATGVIETRIPGMYWCNYFSDVYVDFFGKEKFEPDNWFAKESFPHGTIVYLAEKPNEILLNDVSIEEQAKNILGYDSFANKQEEDSIRKNNTEWQNYTQHKNVPRIFE